MNSYASTIGNIQIAAQQRESELRQRELAARNAAIVAARTDGTPSMSTTARGGMFGALARLAGRPVSAH